MTNIPKRVRALRFLRIIFLVSFIVSVLSLINMVVALGISGTEFPEAAGVTIAVLDTIFNSIAALVAIFLVITLIVTMSVNKECYVAFCLGMAGALMAIVSFILEYTLETRLPTYLLSMLTGFCVAGALFALVDGVYEHQQRKSPLNTFFCIAIGLLVVSAVLAFVTFVAKMPTGASIALYLASEVGYVLAYGIIWGCLQKSFKEIKKFEQSEECLNEAK